MTHVSDGDDRSWPHHGKQLLDDLLWVVNSPSLIEPSIASELLDGDAVDIDHLCSFFSDWRGYRVGHYFERLILYWLTHLRCVDVVAHGLQIQAEDRTLGEVDFLFHDEHGKLTHWEVAVKFYLYESQVPSGTSHFLGPNSNDNFEAKMERLFYHQLPLSEAEFPSVESRHAFVKGMIFYDDEQTLPAILPDRMSREHSRGSFVRYRDVAQFESDDRSSFFVLSKPHWLSSSRNDVVVGMTGTELSRYLNVKFQSRESPVLISKCGKKTDVDSTEAAMREVERIFIISDSWPDHLNTRNRSQ